MSRHWPLLALLALLGCGPPEDSEPPPPVDRMDSGESGSRDEERMYAFRGITIYDSPLVEDFALADQHGRPFRLSEARGRAVLLFFGYVHCPDVCPTTLSTWAKVERELGDESENVAFVFVTVDPERDTPAILAKHLAVFSPSFTGITGSAEELNPLFDAFDIHHEEVPIPASAAGYLVNHTTRMFLIDPSGRLRVKYDFRTRPEDIARDVQWLLEQESR